MIEEFERCRETSRPVRMGVRIASTTLAGLFVTATSALSGEHAEDRPELRGTTGGGGSTGDSGRSVAMAHALGMTSWLRSGNRRAAAQGDDMDCDNAKFLPRPPDLRDDGRLLATTSARPSGPRGALTKPHPDVSGCKTPDPCARAPAVARVFTPRRELGVRGHHPLTNTAPAPGRLQPAALVVVIGPGAGADPKSWHASSMARRCSDAEQAHGPKLSSL